VVNAIRIPQPIGRPRTRPFKIAGDRAYDSHAIRCWLRQHHITAVIPPKKGRTAAHRRVRLDRESYRQRNVIERCIGWLKHARRIATRYEKTALNFLAMLKLAMIQRYFRIHLRDTT